MTLRDEIDRLIAHDDLAHDRLDAVLVRLDARLNSLDQRWERNNALLEEHIRRTELLEKITDVHTTDLNRIKTIMYVAMALASSAGFVDIFGKSILGLLGVP